MPNYTKLAVKGVITVFIISIISAFLGYLVRLTLARNLTVEDFGLFYAVFAFLGLLGLFKGFGFDKALIKFIPDFKHQKRNDLIKSSIIYASVIQFITNAIIIIAIYLFSSYLSVHFFHDPKADIVLKLMAIAFFIDSFVLIPKFVFQGFKKMNYFSIIDFIRMVLILIIILIGFRLNYKLLSPIIAYIVVPVILLFIFGTILFKKVFPEFFKSKFVLEKTALKKISKYSIFVMATSIGGIVLGYTDMMMLTYFSGLTAVGLYSIALPTAKVLIYFARAITGILIPLTSDLNAKGEKKLLKIGIEELYKYSIIILVPAVLILFSFADLVINMFFGKNYILASTPLKILSIGMLFHILCSINWNVFSGIGQPQLNSKMIYFAAVFNFIGNLTLIPLIGINGAAITTTGSYFIIMSYSMVKIRKFIDVKFPVKIWAKVILTGMIFTLIVWFLKRIIFLNAWLETAIVLIISALVYTGLLFLLKIVNINELKNIYNRVLK